LTASGTANPTWSVTGTLPSGMTLDPLTGVLSGAPSTAGTYSVKVTASNSVGSSASQTLAITVNAATGGGSTTTVVQYAYNGDNVAADLTGSGALQTRYVAPDGLNALGARESATGTVAWYVTDKNGSVVGLLDNTGVMQDRVKYDGFGNVVSESYIGFGDAHKYTGTRTDPDTGYVYDWHRWYAPQTGDWISEDPKGFSAGDSNLDRYVKNGPTDATDPTGNYLVAQNNESADAVVRVLQRAGLNVTKQKFPYTERYVIEFGDNTRSALEAAPNKVPEIDRKWFQTCIDCGTSKTVDALVNGLGTVSTPVALTVALNSVV